MEITSQIKNLRNIYDLLALCCEATLLCPDYDYNSGAPCKYMDEADIIFLNYCHECKRSYKKHAFELLKRDIVKYLNKGAGLDRALAIALVIDNRILPKIVEKYSTADKWIAYQSLNQQYRNRIMVIPRKVKSFFDIVQSKKDENGHSPFRKNREIHSLKGRYEATTGKMPDKKLDFLIFPEMLMTDELMDYAKAHINPKAFITVNGSIWKECINKSIMTDFHGTEIFTYFKKALFEYHKDGKDYLEHLNPEENKAYAILEIENFGRISIAICKDLLEPDIRNMLRKINLNFLCIPAYSPSTDLHSEAHELAEQTGCITIIVNSCGALENAKNEVGFICMPAKEDENRSSVIKTFHNSCCYDNCTA